jgi:hypothetical protein
MVASSSLLLLVWMRRPRPTTTAVSWRNMNCNRAVVLLVLLCSMVGLCVNAFSTGSASMNAGGSTGHISQAGQGQENHLFIFGYGNVGQSVASLASKIKINNNNNNEQQDVERIISGLHRNDCGSTNDNDQSTNNNNESENMFQRLTTGIFRIQRSDSNDEGNNNNEIMPLFKTISATITDKSDESSSSSSQSYSGGNVQLIPFSNATAVEMHLKRATHVLITIPPVPQDQHHDATGVTAISTAATSTSTFINPVFQANYHTILSQSQCCQWIGLVSTTGVYGDHDGKWVNEQAALYCCMPPPTVQQTRVTALGTASKVRYVAASDNAMRTATDTSNNDKSNNNNNNKASAFRQMEIQCCNLFGYPSKETTNSVDADTNTDTNMMESPPSSSVASNTRRRQRQVCIFRCAGLYGSNASACHTVLKRALKLTNEQQQQQETDTDTPSLTLQTALQHLIIEQNNNVPSNSTTNNNNKKAINKEESFTSRIHLTDVSRALIASMILDGGGVGVEVGVTLEKENNKEKRNKTTRKADTWHQPQIYNLADDEPEKRSIVMSAAAELLLAESRKFPKNDLFTVILDSSIVGTKEDDEVNKNSTNNKLSQQEKSDNTIRTVPVTVTVPSVTTVVQQSQRARRRATDNKRVDNTKMKQRLLLLHKHNNDNDNNNDSDNDDYFDFDFGGLTFPTYREGLQSIIEEHRQK